MHTHLHSGPWPFSDPENVATITCVHVLDGSPILRVSHDEDDGVWQLLCGRPHETTDARVVCLGCMLVRDDTLREVASLPLGWSADREMVGLPWVREANPPDNGG